MMSESSRPAVATISYTTRSKHLNYGAVLHGWAFQRVLANMGCGSVVIDYIPAGMEGYHLRWPILGAFRSWRNPFLLVRRVAHWLVSMRANLRKCRKFRRFFAERLVCTKRAYTERELAGGVAIDGCDPAVFVCEGDVTWKHRESATLDRGFFLAFPAAAGKRKVAYAPSVAKDGFPPDEEKLFVEYVRGFDAVSSRERAGAVYIAGLLGREVPWFVDSSLLLSAPDYAAIATPPGRGGYVLLYTCMNFNRNMVMEAKRLAERLGKPLVEVGNYGINRYLFGHETIDDAGVEEWLGLFMNADAVVCNSFHGICFSLIFHKPFFAFRRKDDDWRFTGICSEFGLEGRLVDADGKIPGDVLGIDFQAVDDRLRGFRESALCFIRENVVRPALACAGEKEGQVPAS